MGEIIQQVYNCTTGPAGPNMGENRKKPIGRPRGTGTQRVYERMRDKILRLELAPGADLDEAGP